MIYPSSGTGAWEAALVNTLSPGDRVLCFETGHFATLWQELAGKLGLDVDFVPGDWRHGVDPQTVADRLAPTWRAHNARAEREPHRWRRPHQGGARRAQRDLDRRHQPDAGDPAGDRRDRTSRAAARRHDLLARLHRLPARRVGRRRHGRRLAEGADAAARAGLQRGQREGSRGRRVRRGSPRRTGTGGRSSRRTNAASSPTPRRRICCTACGRRCGCSTRKGCRTSSPATSGTPRPPGGRARLGAGGAVRRRARALRLAHRGAGARGVRRRQDPRAHPRPLRHVARRRPRQARRQGVPDRPPRRLQRPDAGRHAGRRPDGPRRRGVPIDPTGINAALDRLQRP